MAFLAWLGESMSVMLQMTLYSSTAIHGHCQVQCTRLWAQLDMMQQQSRRVTEMKSRTKLWGMQKRGSDRGESERKQLGQGWVGYGKWAQQKAAVLFFLSVVCVSWSCTSMISAKLRKDSWMAGRMERWSYRENKGMTGSLNGRRHRPVFALTVKLKNCWTWWTAEVHWV